MEKRHALRVMPMPLTVSDFVLPPDVAAQLNALEEEGKSYLGRLNIYVCDTCRGHIITRDVDTGVTPFMTSCKSTPGCEGMMKSSMYRVFDQDMAASHVWYRPTTAQFLSGGTLDHVMRGGLLLREATAEEKEIV